MIPEIREILAKGCKCSSCKYDVTIIIFGHEIVVKILYNQLLINTNMITILDRELSTIALNRIIEVIREYNIEPEIDDKRIKQQL